MYSGVLPHRVPRRDENVLATTSSAGISYRKYPKQTCYSRNGRLWFKLTKYTLNSILPEILDIACYRKVVKGSPASLHSKASWA